MKKILLFAALSLTTLTTYASGGIAHMYMAEQAISKLSDPVLQDLLQKNRAEYLVGAYYADSGYIAGNNYGEVSHWDPFIFAFADYLIAKYPNPATTNPKLVAFLFGCAAHRITDEVTHRTFYNYVENHDFPGDDHKAQDYGDIGIDLLLNIDQSLWTSQPNDWWVPVKDLLAVYHSMGVNNISAQQIVYGTSILSLTGYGERAISGPAYIYLQWKMPWTSGHYYSWKDGGILMDEQKIANYQAQLWARLQGDDKKLAIQPSLNPEVNVAQLATNQFAAALIKDGTVKIEKENNDQDGSVTIHHPIINKLAEFNAKIRELTARIINQL